MNPTNTLINTTTVRVKQGETIDLILWRLYGSKIIGTRAVEQVLELNHGLADLDPILPQGLVITVPVLTSAPQKKENVKLWT